MYLKRKVFAKVILLLFFLISHKYSHSQITSLDVAKDQVDDLPKPNPAVFSGPETYGNLSPVNKSPEVDDNKSRFLNLTPNHSTDSKVYANTPNYYQPKDIPRNNNNNESEGLRIDFILLMLVLVIAILFSMNYFVNKNLASHKRLKPSIVSQNGQIEFESKNELKANISSEQIIVSLERLQILKEKGTITEEEFIKMKGMIGL